MSPQEWDTHAQYYLPCAFQVPIMHLHPIVQDSDRSRLEFEFMDSRACLTLAITWPQGPLQLQANIGGGSGERLC